MQVGGVSEDFVARAIEAFPAGRARRSAHHFLEGVNVWTLDPLTDEGTGVSRVWTIEFYCLAEEDTWFLSVHPSDSCPRDERFSSREKPPS